MLKNIKFYADKNGKRSGTTYFTVDGQNFAIEGDHAATPELQKELTNLFATGKLEKDSQFPYSAPREYTVDGEVQIENRENHPNFGKPIMLAGSIRLQVMVSAAMKAQIALLKTSALDAYLDSEEAKAGGIVGVSRAERELADLEKARQARIARRAAAVVTPTPTTETPATTPEVKAENVTASVEPQVGAEA